MVATTALLNVQEHNFGRPPGRDLPPRNARVALVGSLEGLTISTGENEIGVFAAVRYANARVTNSVSWRVEGTGDNPLLAEHFQGGVLPSGSLEWIPGANPTVQAAIVLAAASPPVVPLTGRLFLETPVNCEIVSDLAEIAVSVTAIVIEEGDAVVSLNVVFSELDREADDTAYPFSVVRSGSTAASCSVQGRVEGAGSDPVTGALFVGGTLPTFTASFEADETVSDHTLEVAPGSRAEARLTGRITLRLPVDCRLDPTGSAKALSFVPADPTEADPYALVEENWVVHAPSGHSGRVTWLEDGGFEVEGAANTDAFNIAIWCKTIVPANYELTYIYEKNEDLTAVDGGGRFVQVWTGYVGSTGGRPADVTAWTSSHYRPGGDYDPVSDTVYGDFGQGARNSFDTETTVAANRNEIRLVMWDESTDTRPDPTPDPATFPMAGAAAVYEMTVRREVQKLSIGKTPSGELIRWETPLLESLGQPDGRMGFRFGRGRGGIIRPKSGIAFLREIDGPPPPPPPPPGDLFEPIRLASLPPSRRTNVTTAGARTGTAGQNFVLTQNLTGTTLTLGGTGTAGQEIVFRGDSEGSSGSGLRVLTNCTINLNGTRTALAWLVLRNCIVNFNGTRNYVCRCELTDRQGGRDSPWFKWKATTSFASIHKNDFTTRLGALTAFIVKGELGRNTTMAYNLLDGWSKEPGSKATMVWYPGESESSTNDPYQFDCYRNLLVRCLVNDLSETKGSDVDFHENTIESCGSAGFRSRHGRRHRYSRNLFLGGSGALITIRTGPHECTENQLRTLAGGEGGGVIWLYAGKLNWDYDVWKNQRVGGAGDNWQSAGQCTVLGNVADIQVGVESASAAIYHSEKATDNNVGPASGASRNRSVTLKYETGTKRILGAGYDYDRTLIRMRREAVGLRAG